ncbi:hypothetical protein D3C73_1322810 [compost metagenome]
MAEQLVPRTVAVGADLLIVIAELSPPAVGRHAAPRLTGAVVGGASERSHAVRHRTPGNTDAITHVRVVGERPVHAHATSGGAVLEAHWRCADIGLDAFIRAGIGHAQAHAFVTLGTGAVGG